MSKTPICSEKHTIYRIQRINSILYAVAGFCKTYVLPIPSSRAGTTHGWYSTEGKAVRKLKEAVSGTENFISKAKRHTNIEELTPELLRLFIQKTVIHEKTIKWSRYAEQTVEIYYSDIGYIGDAVLRQYRTILFVWLRHEIFRQFVRKCCRQACACQNIFVQDGGKYPSKRAEKAIAANCAVLP